MSMPEHSGHDFMDEAALDAIEDDDVASVNAPDPQDLSDEDDLIHEVAREMPDAPDNEGDS